MREKVRKYWNGQVFFKLPQPIDYYNLYMGSVDKSDQYLKPYRSARKSMAWFKKVG